MTQFREASNQHDLFSVSAEPGSAAEDDPGRASDPALAAFESGAGVGVAKSPEGHRWDSFPKARFAPDSSVEGTGFEPSVPRHEKWSMPSSSDQTRVGRTLTLGGGAESSLEDRDIELSVSPKDIRTSPDDLCAKCSDRRQSREGDRWFESISLQQRVCEPSVPEGGPDDQRAARLRRTRRGFQHAMADGARRRGLRIAGSAGAAVAETRLGYRDIIFVGAARLGAELSDRTSPPRVSCALYYPLWFRLGRLRLLQEPRNCVDKRRPPRLALQRSH